MESSAANPEEINLSITAVPGILVGHAQDEQALTGCTVVLVSGSATGGAVGGVDQRGGAPGTRQTDALRPLHLVNHVDAVVLSGGSAFGLDAATGVVRYLEERGIGFDVGVARVPIVPAAILFDLGLGGANVRPDAAMGYQACLNASSAPPAEGNAGAGTGATVGKVLGLGQAMKSGIGSAAERLAGGLVVGAIAAVNAFGDIIDPATSRILAGARLPGPGSTAAGPIFADTMQVLREHGGLPPRQSGWRRPAASSEDISIEDTVIGVVATNARLTKEEVNKVAQMAQDGIARAVRPAHTMLDGDTIFALATGEMDADVNFVGALAAEVFAQAILRAVRAAQPAGGLPAYGDFYP